MAKSSFSKYIDMRYYLAVAALLIANFLLFPLSGGEEQYLGFTAQWNDPNWIHDSFSFTEFAGTRLIFQWLTAPFVQLFGIEMAAYVLRLINYLALALPITLLFRKWNYSLLAGVLALQTFFILGQNFFGGEWIVRTYEPKSVAYIFVFYALYTFSIQRYFKTAIHLAIATYFHFLVGGWVLILLGVILLFEKKWLQSLKALGIYMAVLLPFVIYLFNGYFTDVAVRENMSADWIYCYYRLPHHTGIFQSYTYFIDNALVGVLLSMGVLGLTFLNYWKNHPLEQKIVRIAFGINLLFVVFAWVDGIYLDQKASFLVKYYPFRTNSVGLLCAVLVLVSMGLHSFREHKKWMTYGGWGIFGVLFLLTLNGYIRSSSQSKDEQFDEIAIQAGELTDANSVFVIIDVPIYDGRNYRFPRLSRRDVLATFKFTPAESAKLYEWYDRIRAEAQMIEYPELVEKFRSNFYFTHVISRTTLPPSTGELIYSNDTYNLYRINHED